MSMLAEYRWYFLIGAEIVFWLAAIGFFLLRYGFRLKRRVLLWELCYS